MFPIKTPVNRAPALHHSVSITVRFPAQTQAQLRFATASYYSYIPYTCTVPPHPASERDKGSPP